MLQEQQWDTHSDRALRDIWQGGAQMHNTLKVLTGEVITRSLMHCNHPNAAMHCTVVAVFSQLHSVSSQSSKLMLSMYVFPRAANIAPVRHSSLQLVMNISHRVMYGEMVESEAQCELSSFIYQVARIIACIDLS